MAASISCGVCAAALAPADIACRACGRALTAAERIALEARFEASNTDYRDSKRVVGRSLMVALVAGLLTIAFASMRSSLEASFGGYFNDPSAIGAALWHLIIGGTLVACFFWGKRAPIPSLWVATGTAHIALCMPYFASPGAALLRFTSPSALGFTLARLGVLIVLIQGLSAALAMKKLISRGSRRSR